MTMVDEEDEMSLPLSDDDMEFFKKWKETKIDLSQQYNKDSSLFSYGNDSSQENISAITSFDIFSMTKDKSETVASEREDEDANLQNIDEITENLHEGEKFCIHKSCPNGYCLYLRHANNSSDMLCKNAFSRKPEKFWTSAQNAHCYLKYAENDRFNSPVNISEANLELQGFIGNDNSFSHLKQTDFKIDKPLQRETVGRISTVKETGKLNHKPSLYFKNKLQEHDEKVIPLPIEKKETLPSFWWLNDSSKYINKNIDHNSVKDFTLDVEGVSKNSSGKTEGIKKPYTCDLNKHTYQKANYSFNQKSSRYSPLEVNSLSRPSFITNSNLQVCEDDEQKYLFWNENDFDHDRAWWKNVKKVNLPDSQYGSTQKSFEMSVKHILWNANKINKHNNSEGNNRVENIVKSDYDPMENKLSSIHCKNAKENEKEKFQELKSDEKATDGIENIYQDSKLLRIEENLEPYVNNNCANTKMEMDIPRNIADYQDDHTFQIKDLQETYVKRARMEYNIGSDKLPTSNIKEDENVKKEVTIIDQKDLHNQNLHVRKEDETAPKECILIDHNQSVMKYWGEELKNNDNADEKFVINTMDNEKSESENSEFSIKEDNMLALEVDRIVNEMINGNEKDKMLEYSIEKIPKLLDVDTGNKNEEFGSIYEREDKKNSDVYELTGGHREETQKMVVLPTNVVETKDEEIAVEFSEHKDLRVEKDTIFAYELCKNDLGKDCDNYDNGNELNKNEYYLPDTIKVEKECFISKTNEKLDREKEFFNKIISYDGKNKDHISGSKENEVDKIKTEELIKTGFESEMCREELLKEDTVSLPVVNELISKEKGDVLFQSKPNYLKSESFCDENTKNENMNEIKCASQKIEMTNERKMIISNEINGNLQSDKEKVNLPKECWEDIVGSTECRVEDIHFEENEDGILEVESRKSLNVSNCLLSEEHNYVLNTMDVPKLHKKDNISHFKYSQSKETLFSVSKDMVNLSDPDLTKEDQKDLSSSQYLEDKLNLNNTTSLISNGGKINIDKIEDQNTCNVNECTLEIKSHIPETLHLERKLALTQCINDSHSEEIFSDLEKYPLDDTENNSSRNGSNGRICDDISDKEMLASDKQVKKKHTKPKKIQKLCLYNSFIKNKNVLGNIAKIETLLTSCPLMFGLEGIFIKNVVNVSFIHINFSNIKLDETLSSDNEKLFLNCGIEKISCFSSSHGEHKEKYSQNEIGGTTDTSINLYDEKMNDVVITDIEKLDKNINEFNVMNYTNIVEIDDKNVSVTDCESSTIAGVNDADSYRNIEKWLSDVGECHRYSIEEFYIDDNSDYCYNVSYSKQILICSENQMEINSGLSMSVPNIEENQWREGNSCVIESNNFEKISKCEWEVPDKIVQTNFNNPEYNHLCQENIESSNKSDEREFENFLIVDNKSSYPTNENVLEGMNLMESQMYPFDNECISNFNPWETEFIPEQSKRISIDEDIKHSKSLDLLPIVETDEKNLSADDDQQEELHLSITNSKTGDNMVEEEMYTDKTDVNEKDIDDISLESYLDNIIEKHCGPENPTNLSCMVSPKNKTPGENVECQTKISGVMDTCHTRTCVENLILSGSEHEICQTYIKKRSLEALNLETARNKRIKIIDFDDFLSSCNKIQTGKNSESSAKKRLSNEILHSEAEKETNSSMKNIKVDMLEERIDTVLQFEEQEWCEATADQIIKKEYNDQKVPDVPQMAYFEGLKGKTSKECLNEQLYEENDAKLRKLPSVSKSSRCVLRLGLSKRARLHRLHNV